MFKIKLSKDYSKAYIVLNKETTRIEESLNETFDESLPKPKSSSSVEDYRIDEPTVQDLNGSPSLQVNVSNEGYPKSLKEARVSSPKSVLDNKALEDLSSNSDADEDWYNVEDNVNDVVIPQTTSKEDRIWDKIGNSLCPNNIRNGYSICCKNTMNMINSIEDLMEENRDMLSSVNEAIKLMLAISINMSCVIENYMRKEESKDNLNDQEHFEGNALDPWIPTLEQGEQQSKGSMYNDIYSSFPRKDQDPTILI
ncbi:hypothetical protein Tco_0174126 [Tanacetum coccineum]